MGKHVEEEPERDETEHYILVRARGTRASLRSPLAVVRRAIHRLAETRDIELADMVLRGDRDTDSTGFNTRAEYETVRDPMTRTAVRHKRAAQERALAGGTQ